MNHIENKKPKLSRDQIKQMIVGLGGKVCMFLVTQKHATDEQIKRALDMRTDDYSRQVKRNTDATGLPLDERSVSGDKVVQSLVRIIDIVVTDYPSANCRMIADALSNHAWSDATA